jgi:hypothetical protein
MPPPLRPQPIARPKLLAGEGKGEVLFFKALLKHLHVSDLQVEEYGGKGNLSRYLRELSLRPGYPSLVALGITRDADGPVAQAFQSVCSLLGNVGLAAPAGAGQIAAGPPRVGVFLLPDNARAGMLEDLCLDAVSADGAMPCVDDHFRCLSGWTGWQPGNRAKARVHTWLASRVEPDRRLGEAAQAGYWPWNSLAFVPLIQFLRSL